MPQPVAGSAINVTGNAVSSITIPAVVAPGIQTAIFVGVGHAQPDATVVSVVRGGTETFEKLWERGQNEDCSSSGWYFKNPSEAAADIVVTFSEASIRIAAGATPLTGVDQDTPVGTVVTAEGASNPATAPAALTARDVDLILDHVYHRDQGIAPGTDQTLLWEADPITSFSSGSSQQGGEVAGKEMTWTLTLSASWTIGAVPFRGTTGMELGRGYDSTLVAKAW